jgi:Xaa-Pro dipeptidase
VARRAAAADRLAEVLTRRQLPGIVLTGPAAVAWASAGGSLPVDRTANVDPVWWAVAPDQPPIAVSTDVEGARLRMEALRGVEVVTTGWWDPQDLVTAAAKALGASADELGSDGHPAFGHDVSHDLVAIRLTLSDAEQAALRRLGHDAAAAVEEAVRHWRPGDTDLDVAATIAAAVERIGARAPVLLVGGDERVEQFRHPVAVGAPMHRLVMAVLVAEREGLHVACTRYAATTINDDLATGLALSQQVHRAVLAAHGTAPVSVGSVVTALADAYRAAGHADAWREHYQGGPIGYAQREFELAPGQEDSPWWDHLIGPGTAVAWNPSLAGGAKDEDTYLLTDLGPELITTTGQWPTDDHSLPRPAVWRTDQTRSAASRSARDH